MKHIMKIQHGYPGPSWPTQGLETNLSWSHQSSPNKERQGKAVTSPRGMSPFILTCKGLLSGLFNSKFGKMEGGEESRNSKAPGVQSRRHHGCF